MVFVCHFFSFQSPCPTGADCRGPKLWPELYALFGFTRLGFEDFNIRSEAFWPCFKDKACLGGKRPMSTTDQPGSKHGYDSWDRPAVDCCSAIDPEKEDFQMCSEDTEHFPSIRESKRGFLGEGYVGFDPKSRGCRVDLSLVDDEEKCHVEMGFRLHCNNTISGKCRLCRACKLGYWAQGVSNCKACPHWLLNIVLVVMAIGFVLMMLMMFLSAALQDTGAASESTVIHFAQAQQKILLNHVQLISLAAGFPLKWPDEVQSMFSFMSLFGAAGSYVFNPACSENMQLVEGESMFFQKQLGILLLPFISVVLCGLFWLLRHAYNLVDPSENRRRRKRNAQERFKRKNLNGHEQKHLKKLNRVIKKRKKRSKKIMDARASKAQTKDKRNIAKDEGKEDEKNLDEGKEESSSVVSRFFSSIRAKNKWTMLGKTPKTKPSGWEAAKFFDETTSVDEETFDVKAMKKNWKKMTHDERNQAVKSRWKHLQATAVDNELDNGDPKDKSEIDGLNEPVKVIQFVVHPLVRPLGIVWVSNLKGFLGDLFLLLLIFLLSHC